MLPLTWEFRNELNLNSYKLPRGGLNHRVLAYFKGGNYSILVSDQQIENHLLSRTQTEQAGPPRGQQNRVR